MEIIITGLLAFADHKVWYRCPNARGTGRSAKLLLSVAALSLGAAYANASDQASVPDKRELSETQVTDPALPTGKRADDQFFERTIQTEVGAPSLVEITAQQDEEEANRQTWYNTLGIGGDENTETLVDGVKDSFISGGSWGYNIYQDIARMYDNAPDDNFSGRKFLEDNVERLEIKDEYRPAYARTSSLGEAMDLHRDIKSREEARSRLQRMGDGSQLVASVIARLPDIIVLLALVMVFRGLLQSKGRDDKQTGVAVQNRGT